MTSLSSKLADLERRAATGAPVNTTAIERLLTAAERKLVDHARRRGALESGVRIATSERNAA